MIKILINNLLLNLNNNIIHNIINSNKVIITIPGKKPNRKYLKPLLGFKIHQALKEIMRIRIINNLMNQIKNSIKLVHHQKEIELDNLVEYQVTQI